MMRERRRLSDADLTPEQQAAVESRRAHRQTAEYEKGLDRDIKVYRREYPPTAHDEELATALATLRLRARRQGLSLADLAERTGIDRATISKLETGKIANPTIVTLRTYAAALGSASRGRLPTYPHDRAGHRPLEISLPCRPPRFTASEDIVTRDMNSVVMGMHRSNQETRRCLESSQGWAVGALGSSSSALARSTRPSRPRAGRPGGAGGYHADRSGPDGGLCVADIALAGRGPSPGGQALALSDTQGNRVVLVTCDIIAFRRPFTPRVKDRIKAKYDIPSENIVLFASHNHAGPAPAEPPDPARSDRPGREGFENNIAYTRELEDKIVAAVGEALGKMEPVSLSYGIGRRISPSTDVSRHLGGSGSGRIPPGRWMRACRSFACRNRKASRWPSSLATLVTTRPSVPT